MQWPSQSDVRESEGNALTKQHLRKHQTPKKADVGPAQQKPRLADRKQLFVPVLAHDRGQDLRRIRLPLTSDGVRAGAAGPLQSVAPEEL